MTTTDGYGDDLAAVSGWVVFAGTITAVAAAVNLIYGLTLLLKDDWIVLAPEAILRFDLTTAGVIFLIFAVVQIVVAMGIFNGDLWARILGIIGASLNIVAQMAFLSLYPAWSFLIILIDALVIYGLAVHGDEVAEL